MNYADLKPLVKKIGRNHDVALGLWDSGVHDARVVATMIAEPEKMTRGDVERWLSDCTNYVITEAVAGVASKMPDGLEIARSWIEQGGEWTTTAGWSVVASNGAMGTLTSHDVDACSRRSKGHSRTAQPDTARDEQRPDQHRGLRCLAAATRDGGRKGNRDGPRGPRRNRLCHAGRLTYIAKMVARQAAKAAGSATRAGGKISAKREGKTAAKSTAARPKTRKAKVPKKVAKASRKTGRKKSARSR